MTRWGPPKPACTCLSQQWCRCTACAAPRHKQHSQAHRRLMHLAAHISSAAFPWCCNSACLTVDGSRRPAADPWLPAWLPSLQSWQLLVPLQVAGQLRKMLNFWGERKVYDRDTLQQLEAAVQSRDRDAQLQPPKVSCSGHHLASRGSLDAEVCQGHLDTAV